MATSMNQVVPMLSVAVITYNQEHLLGEALESILSQGFDRDYEIVIGDDCSSDGTRTVIESYREKYPDIIKPLLNEHNLGITGNYFNVIRHCRGTYIMQCAGDDFWLPGKVNMQIKFMEDNPDIGMCYTKAKNVFTRKRLFDESTWGGRSVLFGELIERNVVPAVTMAFNADVLKRYLGEVRPEERIWPIEDYPEVLWFALRSKIGFLESCTAAYRIVSDSAVHTKDLWKIEKLNLETREIKRFYIGLAGGNEYKEALVKADDALNRSYLSHHLRTDRNLAVNYYLKITWPTRMDRIKYFMCRNKLLYKIFILFINAFKS